MADHLLDTDGGRGRGHVHHAELRAVRGLRRARPPHSRPSSGRGDGTRAGKHRRGRDPDTGDILTRPRSSVPRAMAGRCAVRPRLTTGRPAGASPRADPRARRCDGHDAPGLQFTEDDFRGHRFADHPGCPRQQRPPLPDPAGRRSRGPRRVPGRRRRLITTNSFTGTRIAQADYGLDPGRPRHELAGARLARDAADAAEPPSPIGRASWPASSAPRTAPPPSPPTSTTPPRGTSPGEELTAAYRESAEALIEGGADLLLIETIFDTLNAKAAIFAVQSAFEDLGVRVPLIICGTIVDASGRTLSGQTLEAFWTASVTPTRSSWGSTAPLGRSSSASTSRSCRASPTGS